MAGKDKKKQEDGCEEQEDAKSGKHLWKKDDKEGGPKSHQPLFNFNNGQFRFSIWFFIASLIAIMLFNSLYVRDPQPTEQLIEYSEFKRKIMDDEIRRVHLAEDFYYGSPYFTEDSAPAPGEQVVYKTVPVDDPGLIELMDEKEIFYYAIQQNSPGYLSLILNWLFPFAIFSSSGGCCSKESAIWGQV